MERPDRAVAGPQLRDFIRERDSSLCQYCGAADIRSQVVEHVVPQCFGGHNEPYNLVLSCRPCNARKGSQVWIPSNLDSITQDHPDWRARVLETGTPPVPSARALRLAARLARRQARETADGRAATSSANGRRGGRPPIGPIGLARVVCFKCSEEMRTWIMQQGGAVYLRSLVQSDCADRSPK